MAASNESGAAIILSSLAMRSEVCFGINEHCVSLLVATKCTHAHKPFWPLIKLLPAGQTEQKITVNLSFKESSVCVCV